LVSQCLAFESKSDDALVSYRIAEIHVNDGNPHLMLMNQQHGNLLNKKSL